MCRYWIDSGTACLFSTINLHTTEHRESTARLYGLSEGCCSMRRQYIGLFTWLNRIIPMCVELINVVYI